MINLKLSNAQLTQAFAKLQEMFPEQKALLQSYRQEIFNQLLTGVAPPPGSPVYQVTTPVSGKQAASSDLTISKCDEAIGAAALDGGFFLISMAGVVIPAYNTGAVVADLISEIGLSGVTGLERSVKAVSEASGTIAQVQAIASFGGQFYTLGGYSIIFSVLAESMKWWEWVLLSTQLIAQLVLWFVTDGAALIAQITLCLTSAGFFISACVEANSACS